MVVTARMGGAAVVVMAVVPMRRSAAGVPARAPAVAGSATALAGAGTVARSATVVTLPAVTYAMFDGQFQQGLLHHLAGDPEAGPRLDAAARQLLTMVVPFST